MAMDLNAKAAYIRGLMNGMEFDPNSKNGRIIAAMMDLLEAMAATVTEHDDALDQVYDELDAMDEDMDELEEYVYGDEIEDDEDEDDEDEDDGELEAEVEYELTCPNCGAVTVVDEDTLFNQKISCPNCGAEFDIEFSECDDDECEGCTGCGAPEEEE